MTTISTHAITSHYDYLMDSLGKAKADPAFYHAFIALYLHRLGGLASAW